MIRVSEDRVTQEQNLTLSEERYENLRTSGIAAAEQGSYEAAERSLSAALEVARETGDQWLIDVAFCNWAGVKVALREFDGLLASMREILLRSADPGNCRLAGYHISRIYELQGEYRKGLFYARVARDRTAQVEDPDPAWIASDHNQIANFLVANSEFAQALREYQLALEAQPKEQGSRVATLLQNLGYCHLMLGRPREAFPLLFKSLRTFIRLGANSLRAVNHLDLAYTYLEVDRPRSAIRHAERALALAHHHDDQTHVKNALYLLGEAFHLNGDDAEARRQFERLSDCYEGLPFIADFLLTVDVRRMINLRA